MATKIFYFSTTGNSLALARALSNGLGGAELIPIPNAFGGAASINADRAGFIFPVYGWGVPRIVEEFIQGLKFESKPYVFAVATCGGTPGRTLLELRKLLRKAGADLDAGFACKEGSNTVTDDPGFVLFAKRLNKRHYTTGTERLGEMLETVQAKGKHGPDTSNFAANCFGGMMHGMMALAGDKLKAVDSNYSVDENCKGCRTCERICPRGNVKVEGGRPVWHHNCEMCNGCIQWCPQQAIHMANETCRYHNAAITAADMMLR